MSHSQTGAIWLRIAGLYFVVAVIFGMVMGATPDHDFRLMPVHAHLNLLGWVSMTLIGLLHQRYPVLGQGRLAQIRFWLYQIGVPVMLAALSVMLLGHDEFGPVVGVGSFVVVIAIILFVRDLWRAVGAET